MALLVDKIFDIQLNYLEKILHIVATISNWCVQSNSNKSLDRRQGRRSRGEAGDSKRSILVLFWLGIHQCGYQSGGRAQQESSKYGKLSTSVSFINWIRRGICVAATTVIASVANPAASQGVWISVYASREFDYSIAYGVGWDVHLIGANRYAFEECVEMGGSNCFQLSYFFAACVAVAEGSGGIGVGYGFTKEIAESYSILNCHSMGNINCRVDSAKCPN